MQSEPGKQVSPKSTQPAKVTKPKIVKPSDKIEDLKVGSPAPAITVDKWVKGEPVTGFEKGKVYVVEFWATWCPPCRESIPHLTDLQKKHKDVAFIGVAASEHEPEVKSGAKPGQKSDARLEKLEKFVRDKGDAMGYAVAYDAKAAMVKTWTMPAHENGIPVAFIVGKDSKIAWIGHPMEMESHLDSAIAKAAPKDSGADASKPADANADPKTKPAVELPKKKKAK